jgi:hypothetical protein
MWRRAGWSLASSFFKVAAMQRHIASPPLFAAPTGPTGEILFDDFHARLRAGNLGSRPAMTGAFSFYLEEA